MKSHVVKSDDYITLHGMRKKMTESQRKWDKEHMKTVSCRLDRKTAEEFAAKAADEGKTPYAILKEFIYQYLYGKRK